MRTLPVATLVLAVALALFAGGAQSAPPIGVNYAWDGPVGQLTVVGGANLHLTALDRNGLEVFSAPLSPRPLREFVSNSGEDPHGVVLTVWLDDGRLFHIDRNGDWFWD